MARKLEVEIVGDASSLHRALGKAGSQTDSFGSKLKGLAAGAGVAAGAAGVAGLTFAIKTGIDEYEQAAKVTAQTNAVIKSTGEEAHVTTKHVKDLAGALMEKSGVDDEAIQSGENLILTFTNIRNEAGKGNDVFDQTTKAALDMSTALGTDVTSAAMQLGKALNDPAKGLAKLQRQGVTFTDKQKDLIKHLEATGRTLDAQKVILKEVNKEFGGSAEAAGKTLPGQLSIARETFNNFMGDLVTKAIPILQEVIKWLRDHWPEISKAIMDFWKSVKPVFENLAELVVEVVKIIRDHWDTIGPIVENLAKAVEGAFKVLGDAIKIIVDLLKGDWADAWATAKKLVVDALDTILHLLSGMPLIVAAKALGGAIVQGFKDGLGAIGDAITGAIKGVGAKIAGMDSAIKAWGADIGNAIKDAVVGGLMGIGAAAWDVINNIGSFYIGMYARILGWGRDIGAHIVSGVVDGLVGIGAAAWGVINNIGQWVVDKAGMIAGWGLDIGKGIIGGIVDGIKGIGKAVGAVAGGIAKTVVNAIIGLLNSVLDKLPSFTIPIPFHKDYTVDLGDLIPRIQPLAAGGIVTRPTLALVGERGPEAVVPLGQGGLGTVEIHYHGTVISERNAARQLTALLQRERARGNPAF